VLVGQSLESDIEWLQLEKGVDYKDVIELSELFKVVFQIRNHIPWIWSARALEQQQSLLVHIKVLPRLGTSVTRTFIFPV
jgi:hypothetical protein